jgi:hypothetical protein
MHTHIRGADNQTDRHARQLTLCSKDLIILGQIGEDAQLVGDVVVGHVLRIQQCRNAQVLLGHTERELIVVINVLLLQIIKVPACTCVYEWGEREREREIKFIQI